MTLEEFKSIYTYNVKTDKIGGGGFGTVYRVFDNRLSEYKALKIAEVKDESLSLAKEFEITKSLADHPNIAKYERCYRFHIGDQIFDYGILKYYADGNLTNVQKDLDQEQQIKLAIDVLYGLHYLHQHHYIHRDIKNNNVLIGRDHHNQYIAKITDFGLSKVANTDAQSMISNSLFGGTYEYMAPELFSKSQKIKKNVDIWSYGVLVYELFTGDRPWENPAKLVDDRLYAYMDKLQSLPELWQTVIKKCLVVDIDRRYTNTTSIFNDLQIDLPTVVENHGKDKVSLPKTPALLPQKSNKQVIILGSAFVVLCALALAVKLFPKASSENQVIDNAFGDIIAQAVVDTMSLKPGEPQNSTDNEGQKDQAWVTKARDLIQDSDRKCPMQLTLLTQAEKICRDHNDEDAAQLLLLEIDGLRSKESKRLLVEAQKIYENAKREENIAVLVKQLNAVRSKLLEAQHVKSTSAIKKLLTEVEAKINQFDTQIF